MVSASYGPMRRPPRPTTSQKQQPDTGQWQDGRFTSPEAEAAWHRAAYRQAVNADTWHLGDEIDDQTRDAILAGIGGPTPPMYRGPDGKYRFANAHTIEDAATRGHRAQHFAGKSLDQIAATRMPGEDEYVAMRAAPQPVPANENSGTRNTAANDNRAFRRTLGASAPRADTATTPSEQNHVINGRVAGMEKASKSPTITLEEFAQGADDFIRLGAAGVTGGYADDVAASLNAFFSMLGGADFSETLAANRAEERRLTDAARERRGAAGTVVEFAPNFIPGIGDVSGLLADFKDYLENGDQWTAADWALVAAGLVPGAPNRKTVKSGKSVVDDLLQQSPTTAEISRQLKRTNLDSMLTDMHKGPQLSPHVILENAKSMIYTPTQARSLPGPNRGIIYVDETPPTNMAARAHQDSGEGAMSNPETRKFASAAMRFDNPNPKGVNYIRLDNSVVGPTGRITFRDAKTQLAIWSEATRKKTRSSFERIAAASRQNPEFDIELDMKTDQSAREAMRFVKQEGLDAFLKISKRDE